MINAIQIRGARVHNLKNIDVDVPLNKIVGIAGVSGSGKSSLALGVLYAEGSRRYLDALSTYTRRRMTQAAKAQVDEVLYVPAALALHQRPGVPGIRSTFGTGTELLNSLRLMFSRLASHRCPNGHYVPPTLNVAAEQPIYCPECGALVRAPSAEELAFNSQGACRTCDGTGLVRTVDRATLVPDESISIDDGAVAPWNSLMWSLMTDVCRAMGVRTNVPFRELTDRERDIVFNGPAEKKHIFYKAKSTPEAGELDFTYYNAVYTVENALAKVKDEKGMKRVEKFLRVDTCPDCRGSRLSEAARAPRLRGIGLDEACRMTLTALCGWGDGVPASLPPEMRPMAESICASFRETARRLLDLGLGYLTLDRASSTLSTGERQRMQLARAVRNRTTGVLYVLDEPSIGLHPSNIVGLNGVMHDLIADGNSVVLVDHDTQVLAESDWLIEMGPEAGACGGHVIAEGPVADLATKNIDLLLTINGSPYEEGKTNTRFELAQRRAAEVNAPVIYLNQVGGQDDLVFDGGSFVVDADGYRTQPDVHGKPDVLGLRFRRRTSGQGRDRSGTRPGRRGIHRLRARPQGLHGQEPLHRRDAGPLRRHRLRTGSRHGGRRMRRRERLGHLHALHVLLRRFQRRRRRFGLQHWRPLRGPAH